ncbi:MAG: metal ABC transporter permease, partial [Nitrospiraceae bacterium]
THSLSHMTAYSVGIGIFCATGGVMLSYFWDLPASPAIVLLATTVFFLSVLLSPKRLRRAGLVAAS